MAGEILQGFGFSDGEHFRHKAERLGYDVRQVAPNPSSGVIQDDSLYEVIHAGEPVSEALTWPEVHLWLDQQGPAGDA